VSRSGGPKKVVGEKRGRDCPSGQAGADPERGRGGANGGHRKWPVQVGTNKKSVHPSGPIEKLDNLYFPVREIEFMKGDSEEQKKEKFKEGRKPTVTFTILGITAGKSTGSRKGGSVGKRL